MRRFTRLKWLRQSMVWASLTWRLEAALDVDGNPVLTVGDVTPIDDANTYYPQLHTCPRACSDQTLDNWMVYSSVNSVATCAEPMLIDLALHNPLDDPNTNTVLRVCTSGDSNSTVNALFAAIEPTKNTPTRKFNANIRKANFNAPVCVSGADEVRTDMSFGRSGATASKDDELLEALDHLAAFFEDEGHCNTTSLFSYASGVSVGIYIGASFGKSTVSSAIRKFSEQVTSLGSSETMTAQLCGPARNADHVFGIAANTNGSLASVQRMVSSWATAKCVSGISEETRSLPVWEAETWVNVDGNSTQSNSTFSNNTAIRRHLSRQTHRLQARGDCTVKEVVDGDTCTKLAAKCGISLATFTQYNSELCASPLAVGARACCTEGTLPDIKPKPNADGTCFSYTVGKGEICPVLAARYGLTILQIERFNNGTNGTWGWNGCGSIQAGLNICLSNGRPPFPNAVDGAVCGPTKPGTNSTDDATKWADMNPCPLNACCNIWGNCGINGDFCVYKRGPADNPGTSPINTFGCVSNCGTEITNNGTKPDKFLRVGYYETWNLDRPCLNMRAQHANTDGSYTHMHWAFVPIDTSTWSLKLNNTWKQWDDFKALPNVKKIISIGGWGYSTDPTTYDIIRQAMSPTNRNTFSDNIVKFLNDEGLDGVDFDWEYPGAPDIDGAPSQPTDGANYLKFLTTLRSKISSGKTISIAAPASYWYLKQFPIKEMAEKLDYIVYMTYDLHGQWDAGNQYSMEGCGSGNCLRSHVNLTETNNVLAMITKAGVPTNKIFVGESSYGRSFGMAAKDCTGPDCYFLGDRLDSAATPGMCTDTAGYISNAEIDDIIAHYSNVKSFHDGDSNSDILVYDDYEWVAYMTPLTKDTRREMWASGNFLGTIDWAVDLQRFVGDDGYNLNDNSTEDDTWDWPNPPKTSDCGTTTASSLEDLSSSDADYHCRSVYTLQLLKKNLTASMTHFDNLIKDGYDGKFETYAKAVVDGAPKDVMGFVKDNGNKYFSCKVTEWRLCCDKCSTLGAGFPNPCKYCFKDGACTGGIARELADNEFYIDGPEMLGIDSGIAETGLELHRGLATRDRPPPGQGLSKTIIKYETIDEPCPPDYSARGIGGGNPDGDTVYWSLNSDKHDQFFADLFTATGIEEKDIAFKDQHHTLCAPSDTEEECNASQWDFGIPTPNGYDKSDVGNPKDTVNNASSTIKDLPNQLDDVLTSLGKDNFYGDPDDVVDAIAMPIFMISDALESMDKVVQVADEIDKQKRQAIIFAFLAAIFFFIPIAGEVAGSVAALAGIARIASLIGELGSVAMDIYDVVKDPHNAPLFIFGVLGSAAGLKDIAGISAAAKARRAMPTDDVAKLGTKIKDKLDVIDNIKGVCVRKKRSMVETEPVWPMTPRFPSALKRPARA